MAKDIKLELTCPYLIEHVWKAITDPVFFKQWAFKTEINPVVGYRFNFKLKPEAGLKGIIDCQLIAVEPPAKFSFTVTEQNKSVTTVTIGLKWLKNKTMVDLEHTGFKGLGGVFSRNFFSPYWKKAFLIDLDRVLKENFKIIPWKEYSV